MATKADFNAEEWQAIAEAPVLAGVAVAVAEKGGTIREALALGRTYAEIQRDDTEGAFVKELASQTPQMEAERFSSPQELQSKAFDQIQRALGIVEAKAASEVDSYKELIVRVAERVAAADKSGGFLGIGGTEVSDSERAVLEQIRAAAESGGPGPS
jgi:hypothetical protein